MNSQKFLENYVKMLDEFSQSANTKKFRFECKKAINIPVNAISGINEQHLRDKYESLHNLLIGKSSPNVNQYPQGAAFCKNILAKQIVVCNFTQFLYVLFVLGNRKIGKMFNIYISLNRIRVKRSSQANQKWHFQLLR